MKTSVELSMYPLVDNYEPVIIQFIEKLNSYQEIEVRTNGMSTQVFGEYDQVMVILQEEIKIAFQNDCGISVVMKILNLDTSKYSS